MKYAYYPGCSLETSGAAYDVSTRAVANLLNLHLVELDDWNCCGATEFFSQDELTASAVVARNLALVGPDFDQLVAPCTACYLNLKKTDHLMRGDKKMSDKINEALAAGGLNHQAGRVQVRHLLDVIHADVGEAAIRDKVVRPLNGLKVACYYGCQMVRPFNDVDDSEQPTKLDDVLAWLEAEPTHFSAKAYCCGGHMTQISEPQAFELIRRILQNAADGGADMIACLCPMCQLNLDAYQSRVNRHFHADFRMPVVYFTQLMGLAFGVERKKLGFGKEIVAAGPVLERKLRTLQQVG
ncbi:MAG: CoB--CoM heterodisulfide reductase iron-sulfur subunit B family protein [Pirellulales bacterium]|nr:CoB--CoM heterodisulfide reductase iron-sulfur subunit B family protein [Pirellulales bacterium]